MEVNGGPANSAVTAEVSFSFQDELTATLQNALGVAVEIAVVEITRLLDRALREVQGKIQEALLDNNALKLRLQTAETQLSSVCGSLDQQPQRLEDFSIGSSSKQLMTNTPTISCSSRAQRGCRQVNTLNFGQQSESSVTLEQDYEVFEPKDTNVYPRAPICGNSLGEATLNSDSPEEPTHCHQSEIKNEQHSVTKTDLSCAGTVPSVLSDQSPLEVAVKVEKEEAYGDPIPVSLSVAEETNSDSLSLAQSRLLEDWRPEQLQSESCQSNMACRSSNHPADLDFLSTSGLGQQFQFPKLNNHKRLEHRMFPAGPGPYHCSLCGRDFNRKHHLKIHQRIHTGERPYTCSICSARFRHALTLKRHFRLHTGEKPYTCGQCGKKFRNDGGLRVHQCS